MSKPASCIGGMYPLVGQPLYPSLWHGCVGAWAPCLGSSGLTLRDWSGKSNHGTMQNVANWSNAWGGKTSVSALGSTTYCSASTAGLTGATKFSVSFWCKTTLAISSVSFWSFGASPADTNGVICHRSGTSQMAWFILGGFRSTETVSMNVDNCIILTYDGTTYRSYVNGILSASFTLGLASFSSLFYMGQGYNGHMGGYWDDPRTYNRALSNTEIQLLSRRRGIAYELAPISYAGETAAAYRRRLQAAQLIGGGMIG